MMTGYEIFNGLKSNSLTCCLAGLLVVSGTVAAQDSNQEPHPWRRAADVPVEQAQMGPTDDQGPPPPPNYSANQNYGLSAGPSQSQQQPYPPQQQQQYPPQQQQYPPRNPVPASLTLRPGTYVTVRMDQGLSSDRNQQGDTFFGSLAEPLVVDGVVVAQRGEKVQGRVTEAQKAGRVEGTSKLGVELTGLTLVDGQQVGLHSQMVTRNGQTSTGRDAAAIGGTTALGAAVGASAAGGIGAAIGAGSGAAASIIGVMLTRGRPTVIYPETMLTFQVDGPVTIATDRAPQAFRYANNGDYGQGGYYSQGPQQRVAGPAPGGYYAPYPYASPYYYGPGYYPYYGGLGFSFFAGPRYSYGGFYSRGFRGGFRR